MKIRINDTHTISVNETGALALERLVWRRIEGRLLQKSEVLAIYESEFLLARDLFCDCVGISARGGNITSMDDLSDLLSCLLPLCTEAANALLPLREKKKTEYLNRRQGA